MGVSMAGEQLQASALEGASATQAKNGKTCRNACITPRFNWPDPRRGVNADSKKPRRSEAISDGSGET